MIFFDSESIFSKGFEHFRIYDIEIFYSIFRMIKSAMALDKLSGFWQKFLPIYEQKQMQKDEKSNHTLIKCVGHLANSLSLYDIYINFIKVDLSRHLFIIVRPQKEM